MDVNYYVFIHRANHPDVHLKYVTILLHYIEVNYTSIELNKIKKYRKYKRKQKKTLNLNK